jgi:chromosome segregation ATPase
MLEELKENYRQVRQETADAQLKYEVREAKLRAELEASGAETGQLLIKILELERMQQELLSVLVPVEMTVTLEMDFAATGVEGTASRQKFETLFRQDMSNSTGIPLESIKIINMAAGSVLVDVQLETDSSKSPDAFSAALSLKRQVGDAASPLRTGGLTRSCVDITIKDKKTTMANIERLEKTLIDKEKSLSLAQHEIENLIKGLEQEQQKATDLESQLIEANKHIEMNYMNLEKQENTLKELRGTLEAAGKEITKLKEELEKNITENTILKHKVQTDQSDLLSKISRIDELEGALQETTRRLELHMAQSAAEQEAIDSLEKRLTSANAGIQTLTHQLSEEQTAHESLRAQYRELEATKEMEMNAAKAALNESKQESLKLEKEVSKLQLELHDSQAQVAELWRKVNTLQNEVNSTKKQLAVQKEMSDLANVIYGNIAEMDAALKVLSNELLEEQKFRIQETEKWKSQAVEETALHRTAVDELAAVQFLNGQTTASMSATIKNLEFEIEELTEENNLYKNKVDEVLGHVSKHEISKQALEREKRELQSDYNSHVRQMEQIKDRLDYINREKMETHAELEREKAARSALKVQLQSLSHHVSHSLLSACLFA